MESKQKNQKNRQKKQQKKNKNLPLIVIAAVLVVAAAVLWNVQAEKSQNAGEADAAGTREEQPESAGNTGEQSDSAASREVQIIKEGENLVIPVEEVSETAQFYPIEVDGTDMEIIAVKDSGGTIRTAFNTCQVCYGSGRGYYVQQGDALVCQNCGNRYTVDMVEVQSGGCNPYPIFADNKTEDENSILISYDFLHEATGIFKNWKN